MQDNLMLIRKRKDYTQSFIADYLGITAKAYRDKELGRTKFNSDEMFKLAQLFGEKIENIFLPTTHQNGVK